jgi:hypothetical protein
MSRRAKYPQSFKHGLSPAGRLSHGRALCGEGRRTQAEFPFFLFNLGDSYRLAAHLEKAVDANERSIAIDPAPQTFR